MSRRTLPDGPWQDVAIDFKNVNDKYLCVISDYFSRYIEVKEKSEITTETTVKFSTEIFARFEIPYSITSDSGRQFTSRKFTELCSKNGIKHYTTPPYWAQENGEIERQMCSLQKVIKIALLKKEEVTDALNNYLLMYRSVPHAVTGKSPADLIFGRKIRDKLPILKERHEETNLCNTNKSLLQSSRSVEHKEILPGDEVLVERRKSKMDSKFEEETGTVREVNGPEVTVQMSSKIIRQHKNQIEPYTRRTEGEVDKSSPV